MNIEDVIHLYLGCEVIGTYNDASGSKGYLTGVTNGGYECEIQFILENGVNVSEEPEYNPLEEVKPLLRPLSSMTEKEFNEFKSIADNDFIKMVRIASVETENITANLAHQFKATAYLLSKYFDLFGLIDAGLAIDATTLTTKTDTK